MKALSVFYHCTCVGFLVSERFWSHQHAPSLEVAMEMSRYGRCSGKCISPCIAKLCKHGREKEHRWRKPVQNCTSPCTCGGLKLKPLWKVLFCKAGYRSAQRSTWGAPLSERVSTLCVCVCLCLMEGLHTNKRSKWSLCNRRIYQKSLKSCSTSVPPFDVYHYVK